MELNQLRYFCAVAKNQHITQTAEQLHIAQPALSQSIRRLERELGVPLLQAKGRGIALTSYGQYVYEQATPILRTLDLLPQELATMANQEQNTVHINVLAASSVVTSAMIGFQQSHGETHFQIRQNQESDLCDIEVTTRLFYLSHQKNCFVFTEEIYLAVPDRPPYQGRTSISLEEVSQAGFICLAGSTQFRAICDKFCNQAGFSPDVSFESDAPATVRNLIAAGMGIGFWPQYSWGKLDTSNMLLLPIANTVCHRDIVITLKAKEDEPGKSHDFFHFLVSYIKEFLHENLQKS